MAVIVWLVRNSDQKLNRGRLGLVRVESELGARLIKKGDALLLSKDLRRQLAERAEAGDAPAAEAVEPNDPPRKRGRPRKAPLLEGDSGGGDDDDDGGE